MRCSNSSAGEALALRVTLPPISLAKSDSLRSAGTAFPADDRAGGWTFLPYSFPHSRSSVTAPLAVDPLARRRFNATSSANISTFSNSSSGCSASMDFRSTSIPAPFLPIGRTKVVPNPAITLSSVSTSSLIGRRAARSDPISTSPLAARPEKSPIRAMRNRAGLTPSAIGVSSVPNDRFIPAPAIFIPFRVIP